MATIPSKSSASTTVYNSIKQAIINDLNSSLFSKQNMSALSPADQTRLMSEFKDPPRGAKLGWTVSVAQESQTYVTGVNTTATRIVTFIVVQ